MTRKKVDYHNFVSKFGTQAYKIRKMTEKGTPYQMKIGEINFVDDFNDASVTGSDITISFSDKKPHKTLLIGMFFEIKEDIVSYGGNEVTLIAGQPFYKREKGDINVDVTLDSSNDQDWTAGQVIVYALLTE